MPASLDDCQSPDELAVRVAQLRGEFADGNNDAQARRALARQLTELRQFYRRNPQLFRADVVAMLQELARSTQPPQSQTSPEQVLHECFGYHSFRPGQREIIDSVLAGRDCLGIMPTGAGKSITYQIPARIKGGVTLVVSPLISLMKDQVDAMSEAGIRATFLNSSLTPEERADRVRRLKDGEFELLYAAPEGLLASVGRELSSLSLSLVAVDEAHCISQWGHDFRPAYRSLRGIKRRFENLPVLALTATATERVTSDIIEQLSMQNPRVFRGSFFRRNLRLHAFKKGQPGVPPVRQAIERLVRARAGESGIVYCLSRKSAETTADYLSSRGVAAGAYHAGLSPDQRSRVQDAFQNDQLQLVVATIAFGMGIDKSNVRYVIHRDMPRSVEGYYQEVGRAGRDGVDSDCVLFYSWAEVNTYDRFASEVDDDEARERQQLQVRQMFRFAEHAGCRHQAVVSYFGESLSACGTSCDHCLAIDVLAQAQAAPRSKSGAIKPAAAQDNRVFDALRALRRELADARGVPAYVVFSDATLLEMAELCPGTLAELSSVSGVGPKKLELYGESFLRALNELTSDG